MLIVKYGGIYMLEYIEEFKYYIREIGLVSKIAYSEENRVICVYTDLSVRELLENHPKFVEDITMLAVDKCGLRITYCDNIFSKVSTEGYEILYREDEKGIEEKYIKPISERYKSMRTYAYKGRYLEALEDAFKVLYDSLYMVLSEAIEGYGVSSVNLNVVYEDFKETIKIGYGGESCEFLDRMIPYIDYARHITRYADYPQDGYHMPLVDITSDEMNKLIREITKFCCNCICLAFRSSYILM